MSYSEWEVRPTFVGKNMAYEIYRVETGGTFKDREEAEHLAYELNKEAKNKEDKKGEQI